MYWLDEGDIVPLYVGKAGKYGRDGDDLSANLRGLRGSSTSKFARWRDGHYYHIGNLSAIVFDHDKNQNKNTRSGSTDSLRRGDNSNNRRASGRRRGARRMSASITTLRFHSNNWSTRLSGWSLISIQSNCSMTKGHSASTYGARKFNDLFGVFDVWLRFLLSPPEESNSLDPFNCT